VSVTSSPRPLKAHGCCLLLVIRHGSNAFLTCSGAWHAARLAWLFSSAKLPSHQLSPTPPRRPFQATLPRSPQPPSPVHPMITLRCSTPPDARPPKDVQGVPSAGQGRAPRPLVRHRPAADSAGERALQGAVDDPLCSWLREVCVVLVAHPPPAFWFVSWGHSFQGSRMFASTHLSLCTHTHTHTHIYTQSLALPILR
jgi:hypothetical protein